MGIRLMPETRTLKMVMMVNLMFCVFCQNFGKIKKRTITCRPNMQILHTTNCLNIIYDSAKAKTFECLIPEK